MNGSILHPRSDKLQFSCLARQLSHVANVCEPCVVILSCSTTSVATTATRTWPWRSTPWYMVASAHGTWSSSRGSFSSGAAPLGMFTPDACGWGGGVHVKTMSGRGGLDVYACIWINETQTVAIWRRVSLRTTRVCRPVPMQYVGVPIHGQKRRW